MNRNRSSKKERVHKTLSLDKELIKRVNRLVVEEKVENFSYFVEEALEGLLKAREDDMRKS